MKTALKIGFSMATQHWRGLFFQTRFFILTFVLLTLLESFVLFEANQLLRWLDFNATYYRSGSIVGVNFFDFSNVEGSLGNYLLDLTNNFFFELIILNTFFLGVYYHYVGFPTNDTPNKNTAVDNVLDVPIENKPISLDHVLSHIEKESRVHYFKLLVVFFILQFVGNMIGRVVYDIAIIVGYSYYWLFHLLPYVLLLLLYLKWLNIPFGQFWKRKNKWFAILVLTVCVPAIGSYIFSMVFSILTILSYSFSTIIELDNLMRFLGNVIYIVLLIPFLSIFYSQTLIHLKDEQEA